MTKAELRTLILDILREIQTNSGRPVPDAADDICVLEDLDGFDSLNAEEATTMMSDRLGVEIHDNPFFDDHDRPLRLSEVVGLLLPVLESRGALNNAQR